MLSAHLNRRKYISQRSKIATVRASTLPHALKSCDCREGGYRSQFVSLPDVTPQPLSHNTPEQAARIASNSQRVLSRCEYSQAERELAIYRSQRQRKPAKQRPHFEPQERAEILQLMRLRGWSCKEAAARFVLHPNMIRNWKKSLREKHKSESVVGAPPWNKLHGGVRWLVHEMRQLCTERDFGTRTIARYIMRSGIQISRASVRRILEEERAPIPHSLSPPLRTRRMVPAHLVHPPMPHHIRHIEITSLRVLWMKLEVAAIIDGCSRKMAGVQAFAKRPTTDDLIRLIDESTKTHSIPRFIISDRGSQFQRAFHIAMIQRGIAHARGPIRVWQFNAKVERLFWSLKRWWRVSQIPPNLPEIQKRLENFASWHNLRRPHAALGMMTPSEVELGWCHPDPIRYTEEENSNPESQSDENMSALIRDCCTR